MPWLPLPQQRGNPPGNFVPLRWQKSGLNSIAFCAVGVKWPHSCARLLVLRPLPPPVAATRWWSRLSWQPTISIMVHLCSPSGPSLALQISS